MLTTHFTNTPCIYFDHNSETNYKIRSRFTNCQLPWNMANNTVRLLLLSLMICSYLRSTWQKPLEGNVPCNSVSGLKGNNEVFIIPLFQLYNFLDYSLVTVKRKLHNSREMPRIDKNHYKRDIRYRYFVILLQTFPLLFRYYSSAPE